MLQFLILCFEKEERKGQRFFFKIRALDNGLRQRIEKQLAPLTGFAFVDFYTVLFLDIFNICMPTIIVLTSVNKD